MSRKGENIFRRKDGRWEARWIHHYEKGQAKYRYLYGKSYTEVRQKRLDALKYQVTCSDVRSLARIEEIALLWLGDVRGRVKESTFTRYDLSIRQHLIPTIGQEMIGHFDLHSGNLWVSDLLSRGGKAGTGLSPKSVTDLLCLLKAIFKYGKEIGYPCADLSSLRAPKRQQTGVTLFRDGEREQLEQALLGSTDPICLGILLSFCLGLRIGEVCGLKWADYREETETLVISRTVERISDLSPGACAKTKIVVTEPKTENALRTIPLPSFLSERLNSTRMASNFYILSGDTVPMEPHALYKRYKKFLRDQGIEDHTFHSLRHTFATRCIEAGFDAKSLSEILGHASVSTTMSLYVHPSLESKRAQLTRLMPGQEP